MNHHLVLFMGATLAPLIWSKLVLKVKCPDNDTLKRAIEQPDGGGYDVQCRKTNKDDKSEYYNSFEFHGNKKYSTFVPKTYFP